ncbi:MAG TPA: sensor domain-containing protein [Mycobacteriales bacterium]|nr:sensor domain-containing protein [Mycobacteriales bacterium]
MRVLKVYAERRTWAALGYCLFGFPLAIAGFVFVVVSLSVSVGLSVTLIGLPLLGLAVAMSRGWGAAYRGMGRAFLDVDVAAPTVRRRPGLLGYIGERNGWRAILFLFLRFPLAIIEFVVAVSFFIYSWGGLTYPIWWHDVSQKVDHEPVYGLRFGGGPHEFANTTPWIAAVFAGGLALALLWPWVLRGLVSADRALIRGLLGPSEAERRIESLEQTRTIAVDESAAALRRIERDLHDGAQARLVGLAMSLGMVKDELAGADSDVALTRVRELVDAAHREAKGTIADLRDLARGIHPPALDNGLPDALQTLTARAALATSLRVDLPRRPTPAIESIVYFCTAELLTNAVKHSGAHRASVDVRWVADTLYLRVHDDGGGGAAPRLGSGLSGLADRIATVDGTMEVVSPAGGPTDVTISIPVAEAAAH